MLTHLKLILSMTGLCLSVIASAQVAPLTPKIEAQAGDFYAPDSEYGVVLKTPNGSCYRIRVADDGAIFSEIISCPDPGTPFCDASHISATAVGIGYQENPLGSKPQLKYDPDGQATLPFIPDQVFFTDPGLEEAGKVSFYQRRWSQIQLTQDSDYNWSQTDRVFLRLAKGIDDTGSTVTDTWSPPKMTMIAKIMVGQGWMTANNSKHPDTASEVDSIKGPTIFPTGFLEEYEDFLVAFLEQYKGHIAGIAIENEASALNFSIMSQTELFELTTLAWSIVDQWNQANPDDRVFVMDHGINSAAQGALISRYLWDPITGIGNLEEAINAWNIYYSRRGPGQGGRPQIAAGNATGLNNNLTNDTNTRYWDTYQTTIDIHNWGLTYLQNTVQHKQLHSYDAIAELDIMKKLHEIWSVPLNSEVLLDVTELGIYDPADLDDPAPSGPGWQATNPEAEMMLGIMNHFACGSNSMTQLPTTTVGNKWEERLGLVDKNGDLRGNALRLIELSQVFNGTNPRKILTEDADGNRVILLGSDTATIALADLTDGILNPATGRMEGGDYEYGWLHFNSSVEDAYCQILTDSIAIPLVTPDVYIPIPEE